MVEFEWDERKARDNLRKHGVSFEQATQAFRDVRGLEWIDESEDYGEERSILLGMTGDGLLMVVHADRSIDESVQRIRLISARQATRDEEDYYYRENG
ncbi:MAG: BrnT family toxin [Vitreimonas sp.]